MEKYSEIIRSSLVDFEEIKLILANNNIDLVSSKEIRERYYLKNGISFKSASYQKIIENSYILANVNDKVYLAYKKEIGNDKEIAYLSIANESACLCSSRRSFLCPGVQDANGASRCRSAMCIIFITFNPPCC